MATHQATTIFYNSHNKQSKPMEVASVTKRTWNATRNEANAIGWVDIFARTGCGVLVCFPLDNVRIMVSMKERPI